MNRSASLRHVVIGVGAGIFNTHRRAFALDTTELVAVSDIDAERGQQQAVDVGCTFFTDHHTMLAEIRPDVAVILTPHPFHASLAIDCLNVGCHVLVEKPMAVHVAEADAMVEAAAKNGRLLAVNFQQRHRPEVQAARRLIQSGQLGDVQHVEMKQMWTRTTAYYALAGWRGTWAGEGGGVLMNQAPHNLDLLCYLLGMPSRVVAWTRNLLHNIETEDTVEAMVEWPNGGLGTIHISTAEAGPPPRFEVLGTRGWLQISGKGLDFQQFEPDLREFVANSPNPFAAPEKHVVPVALENSVGDHVAVYRNLHAAILQSTPLMADGVQGRMSLELANAMIYSSYNACQVEFPLDRQEYRALITDLQAAHS